MLNALVQLHIAGLGVFLDVFRVLLHVLHGLVLDDDLGGQFFHEGVQFGDGALDLLDVVVAGTDGAENGAGGCAAVGFELRSSVSRVDAVLGWD